MSDESLRFSVAIDAELLADFDAYCEAHRFANRSEAVRALMRTALVDDRAARDDSDAFGVLILVYDHHAGRLTEKLTELQHRYHERVVTTTHVHLDAHRCLEVILLRGEAQVVRELANALIGTRGVEHGRLVLATARLPSESAG
jgi:CopG family nickel-responsive transcriptional regulator